MSAGSLERVVTGAFIKRLAGLAQQSRSNGSGGSGSTDQIGFSSGLRIGAQAFSSAVRNLNATISTVNLARATLRELGDVTDDMITLAKEASESSTNAGQRERLHTDFQSLVDKFRSIVSSSALAESGYLSREGLENLFEQVGLDPARSGELRAVFEKFILTEEDSFLASEADRAARPIEIPTSAFSEQRSRAPYRLSRVSPSAATVTDGYISATGGVFRAVDNLLNQNPGDASAFAVDRNGSVSSQPSTSAAGAVLSIVSVNETTGYSLVISNRDPFGFNAGNYNELFMLDESGNFVQQLTDSSAYTSASYTATMSADNTRVAIGYLVSSGGVSTSAIGVVDITTFGVDPTSLTVSSFPSIPSNVGASLSPFENVNISNDGNYLYAYDPTRDDHYLYKLSTAELDPNFDSFMGTTLSAAQGVGFLSNGKLAVLDSSISLYSYQFNAAGGSGAALTSGTFNDIAVLQSADGQLAYVSGFNSSTGAISLYSIGLAGDTADLIDLSEGAGVSYLSGATSGSLSLAYNNSAGGQQSVEIGLYGNVGGETGLYRLSYNEAFSVGPRVAASEDEIESLSDQSLLQRPDAFRALADLEALKEQIDGNDKILGDVISLVAENISLVREAGRAFLQLGDQIGNEKDAEKLADRLRKLIRENARGALSQAENLEYIVVASLSAG